MLAARNPNPRTVTADKPITANAPTRFAEGLTWKPKSRPRKMKITRYMELNM